MTPYQPFLVAPFKTGLDTDQEPWLLPVDAFKIIQNGHIHHGYIEKREGYRYLGNMVHGDPISAATNADPAVFSIADTSSLTNGDTVSLHYLSGGSWANLNGLKYTITVLSGTTFSLTDSSSVAVSGVALGAYTASSGQLGTFPSDRIMGIFRYIGADNTRALLIADTKRVAIYNAASEVFEPLDLIDSTSVLRTNTDVFDSSDTDYIWSTNWQAAGFVNRVYFTNGKAFTGATPGTDGIIFYDASSAAVEQFQPTLNSTQTLYGCKLIFTIKNRLLCLYTFENNGASTETFPQRARWSAARTPSNWDDSTSGGGDFLDAATGEQIISARLLQDIIIVNFTDSVWTLRPVSDPANPFRWDKVNSYRACDAKMGTIAYDRYIVAVGQRGITATDGVQTRRIDERIEDFTSDDIYDEEFDKVFGERSYAKRRTWLLYPDDTNSDANAALIYDDESGAYSKYVFSKESGGSVVDLNVLGYGSAPKDLAAEDFIAANNLDVSADDFFDDETSLSFFWSKNSEIFLGGDRVGVVNILETGGDDGGTGIEFSLTSAGWNPFKDQGLECQFGYIDIYFESNQLTKLSVQFYKNDSQTSYATRGMDLLPDLGFNSDIVGVELAVSGDPTQGLLITSVSHGLSDNQRIYIYGVEGMEEVNDIQFIVTVVDENSFTVDIDATGFGTYTTGGKVVKRRFYRTKTWKRVYAGGAGYVHTMKITSDGANRGFKIHAFKPWFRPIGKRILG
jgi:hypothetical protein